LLKGFWIALNSGFWDSTWVKTTPEAPRPPLPTERFSDMILLDARRIFIAQKQTSSPLNL
jgi:hypothetical protein